MLNSIAAKRLSAVGVLAIGLVAVQPGSGGRTALAAEANAVGALYQFEAALDAHDEQRLIRLFTPDAHVSDGVVCVGTDALQDWIHGLIADDVWLTLTEEPDVAPTSGQPLVGEWAIISATISRASLRPLGVDPQVASIAAVVQGDTIAYLAVRSDMLWARQYRDARAMQVVVPPVPAALLSGE
jgi:hypothetical protein